LSPIDRTSPYLWREGASCIDYDKLISFLPEEGGRIKYPKRFKLKTIDNVPKHNNCINILSSQTFRSYLLPSHIYLFFFLIHTFSDQYEPSWSCVCGCSYLHSLSNANVLKLGAHINFIFFISLQEDDTQDVCPAPLSALLSSLRSMKQMCVTVSHNYNTLSVAFFPLRGPLSTYLIIRNVKR
jgi:hypothetical protein